MAVIESQTGLTENVSEKLWVRFRAPGLIALWFDKICDNLSHVLVPMAKIQTWTNCQRPLLTLVENNLTPWS